MLNVIYIVSDIDKALAFEWVAQNIDKATIKLSFVLLNADDSHLERFLIGRDIPVTRIKCNGKKDWLFAWWKLFRYLRVQNTDVVHCHLLTASILGLSAAKVAGVKRRIYTRHHSDYHFRYFPKGVKWDKFCNYLATTIIAPSGTVKKILTEMESVPEAKVKLIHHGFDLNYFNQVPKGLHDLLQAKYNPANKSPVIGVISRFTELKGIQYIIPAFQKLLIEYPNALLLLFNARGDYEQQIRYLLSALPEDAYSTVAFEQELATVYSLFNVFVQVSTDTNIEAFGQTYVEALAAGVPSVFTMAGIAPDFVKDGDNALVVPFKDAEAIYKAIAGILKEKNLSAEMAAKGKMTVMELFALPKMIQLLQEVYKNK